MGQSKRVRDNDTPCFEEKRWGWVWTLSAQRHAADHFCFGEQVDAAIEPGSVLVGHSRVNPV